MISDQVKEGHVARMQKRNVYGVLVRKPEGKRPLGGPRHTWEDINKMGWYGLNSFGSGQDLVNTAMKFWVA
jgi:hypothetical protein